MLGLDGRRLDSADSRNTRTGVKDTLPFDAMGRSPLEFPRCTNCGETIAVKNALFCKACGGRLFALPRLDEDLSVDAETTDSGRLAARKEWRWC
jgi:DNA-directed RNA polymerase subunit RPC12/RpoP